MDNLLGLLRIRVKRGINLAIRDFRSSDPYCIVTLGEQRLKTHIVDRNLNPVWNEDLTLSIENPDMPVGLRSNGSNKTISYKGNGLNVKLDLYLMNAATSQLVFDHDTFTRDDEMGDAEFDIKPFLETQKMNLEPDDVPNGTTLKRIKPSSSNCLSEESCIIWQDGNVVQNMLLKLRNVECGEIELELHWIDLPH